MMERTQEKQEPNLLSLPDPHLSIFLTSQARTHEDDQENVK